MRHFYAFTLLFILVSCQKDEKKKVIDHTKTDWAFYKLNGNIKSITTKSWEVNDQLEKQKVMHEDMIGRNSDLSFNEDGELINERLYVTEVPLETKTYNGRNKLKEMVQYVNNAPVIKTIYDYDASGDNNITITRRNGDNTEIDHIKKEYHNGNLAKQTTFSSQNIPTETTGFIYDSKGNVIEEDFYLTANTIQYKTIHKYDKKNRKTSQASYTANGKKNYETISSYEGNNLVKRFTSNDKNETEFSEEFTYDKKGNILTKLTYEKFDNIKTLDKFMYDDNGNTLSWQVIKNDAPYMSAIYSYDQHNNQTSSIASNDKNIEIERREYSYEYDAKGNWIKKTMKLNGKPKIVAERTISYFNSDNKQ